MSLDELSGQRQSKPKRGFAPHARLGHSIEPVEHAWKVLAVDAGAVVADLNHRLLLVAICREGYAPLAIGIGDCVLKHMLHGFAKPACVTENMAGSSRDLNLELLRLFCGSRL